MQLGTAHTNRPFAARQSLHKFEIGFPPAWLGLSPSAVAQK